MASSPENTNLVQNQDQQSDEQKLFKPSPNPPPHTLPTSSSTFPSPSGNLNSSPSFPTPAPTSSTPYLMPSSSYPPPTGPSYPFHPDFLPYAPSLLDHFQHQYQNQQQHQLLPNSAYLMALLTTESPPSSPSNSNNDLDFPQLSMPASSPSPSNSIPSVPPPTRLLSTKLPKGRHLIGDRVVYDIDARLQGEVQPQLAVTPITKYGSDPSLVLGRQIAVNRSYICYGLKLGNIRVLNINTASRSLLRGHTQRVTDMAFFAEDVHLLASAGVDGRVFVWKIDEGPDEENKPQITGKIVIAIHIEVGGESVHPRVCWHPHKQEILMVAIGSYILKIDNTKVGKGEVFSAEKPLKCSIDELIDGIQLVGKHDQEVTELSMCQWITSHLASASIDGSVKIWADLKALPLAVFRPHDSNPVHSVTFLTAPHRPDHIVLITAGPLNQEVKIWTSAGEGGWLLPSDTESWKCTQTLDIKSSSEPKIEDAFFNQVISLPRAGLLLLANAKKNAIYAVHIEYGPNPAATRMDYISEFTVTMPILSLTGTSDSLPDGEHIVQVYCIQTQAIQQYALYLSQCLPPPLDNVELEKSDSTVSRVFDGADGSASSEPPHGCKPTEISVVNATPMPPILSSSAEIGPEVKVIGETGTSQSNEFDNDVSITKAPNQPPNTSVEEVQNTMKDVPTKVGESETPVAVLPSPAPAPKGKRQKGKNAQVSGSSSPSPSPFNSTDSSNEPGGSSGAPSIEAALPQLLAMRAVLDQLMSTQKEMKKQMNVIVSGSFSKEGKRLEGSLGRSMEKVIRANTDALCARFQEENTKQEKLEHDRMQQITNLITNHLNKDLPAVLEKTLKQEIALIGPAVAREITPIVEKTVSSSIMDSFQKGVGDEAVNQLEKSVSSKLEGTVTRQIQAQFQISGKQILQDALRSSLEASIIPAFEISCKAMFEQVDITLQKVLGKHTTAAEQQFEATHSPLAIALRDAINSASVITQTLSGELADGQRQLLAIAAAGANSKAVNPSVTQLSTGPLALLEMGEAPLDPTKELSRLIAECKFEEAFTGALHRRDVSIVSWLCSQVDLQRILSTVPLPLSQGVLLALLQQLSYDIGNETPRKLTWMTDIALTINPADPAITVHVHPIFEQVYQILGHRRNLPTTSASEASSIRLLMHVINSVLMSK